MKDPRKIASRMDAAIFIRSVTSTAGPRTSTGLPLERSAPLRSTTVTEQPLRVSQ